MLPNEISTGRLLWLRVTVALMRTAQSISPSPGGVGYEGKGKLLEAISEYQKAVELSDGNLDATASLAHAFAVIGRSAEARKILGDLERKSKTVYVSSYVIATMYAGLGDKDKAFELLEKAYQEKSLELSWHLKADLRIDNLRPDPRFQRLLRRVGLPA